MDMSTTIIPKSDQINSDDLITGPITVTIANVSAGNPEQPVNIHVEEFPGRAYRPSKSMRRVLVAAWGKEANTYTGKRMTLYRNPDIKFGRDVVGGIEISHMSDLEKPLTVSLTATRGKRRPFTVQPLPDLAPAVTVQDVEQCTDLDMLRSWWGTASEDVKTAITARANTLADLHAAAEQSDGELVQAELIDEEVQS